MPDRDGTAKRPEEPQDCVEKLYPAESAVKTAGEKASETIGHNRTVLGVLVGASAAASLTAEMNAALKES